MIDTTELMAYSHHNYFLWVSLRKLFIMVGNMIFWGCSACCMKLRARVYVLMSRD